MRVGAIDAQFTRNGRSIARISRVIRRSVPFAAVRPTATTSRIPCNCRDLGPPSSAGVLPKTPGIGFTRQRSTVRVGVRLLTDPLLRRGFHRCGHGAGGRLDRPSRLRPVSGSVRGGGPAIDVGPLVRCPDLQGEHLSTLPPGRTRGRGDLVEGVGHLVLGPHAFGPRRSSIRWPSSRSTFGPGSSMTRICGRRRCSTRSSRSATPGRIRVSCVRSASGGRARIAGRARG